MRGEGCEGKGCEGIPYHNRQLQRQHSRQGPKDTGTKQLNWNELNPLHPFHTTTGSSRGTTAGKAPSWGWSCTTARVYTPASADRNTLLKSTASYSCCPTRAKRVPSSWALLGRGRVEEMLQTGGGV